MRTADPTLDWQRTSPAAVVFFLARSARQIIGPGLPALAGLLAWFSTVDDVQWDWLVAAVIGLGVIAVGVAILSYLRFRFRIIEDRILVRSGIFHREEISVEFDRVQNINIREPFYMRPFRLALFSIDTAGSGSKEITLGGIAKPVANALRETILGSARSPQAEQEVSPSHVGSPRLLLARNARDIAIYGLTINFLFWIVIALGASFGAYDFTERLFLWLAAHINVQDLLSAVGLGSGGIVAMLLVTGLTLLILLLLPLASVVGALLRHYGYRLTVDGETYRRSSGLLSRQDESLQRHKIQALVWKQNFVARLFARTNLQLRIVSAGSGVQGLEQGQLPSATRPRFLVPSLHPDEVRALTADFLPGCEADKVVFSPVDRRRFISKNLLLGWLPPILGISVVPTLFVNWTFALLLPVALGAAWLILHQIWKRLGYGVVGEYGFIRSGFIGSATTVFALYKVQRIDLRQTPHQRRAGFATLTIHLASHSLTVPYMPVADAEWFRDLVLYYVESTRRPWY